MKTGRCIKCKDVKEIDASGLCSKCYPYDESTDRFKRHKERRGKVNGKDVEV